MAASAGGETVMAPGNLVISAYVTCPDITKTVTPDLKLPGSGKLIHVDLAEGYRRLGGSSLAQVRGQEKKRKEKNSLLRYPWVMEALDRPMASRPNRI